MTTYWKYLPFHELSLEELYHCMVLRMEVFVVEQNCPYQDADKKDPNSLHLMGYTDSGLIAYSRILPPGIAYTEVSFGRFTTSLEFRNQGVGNMLMNKTMDTIRSEFGNVPVRIGAQSYLRQFYEKWGFRRVGEEYLEDDIPHVEMLRA